MVCWSPFATGTIAFVQMPLLSPLDHRQLLLGVLAEHATQAHSFSRAWQTYAAQLIPLRTIADCEEADQYLPNQEPFSLASFHRSTCMGQQRVEAVGAL